MSFTFFGVGPDQGWEGLSLEEGRGSGMDRQGGGRGGARSGVLWGYEKV